MADRFSHQWVPVEIALILYWVLISRLAAVASPEEMLTTEKVLFRGQLYAPVQRMFMICGRRNTEAENGGSILSVVLRTTAWN